MTVTPTDVLDFWFGAADAAEHGAFRREWFTADAAFDAQIHRRFRTTWERLCDGELESWRAAPENALAYLIVADQFPRNCFRGSPRAFATDALALVAAQALVDTGTDRQLSALQRCFVYLPFEHAESLAMQDRSVALYATLVAAHPDLQQVLDFARRHRDVIARFGRFPHRNTALGRESTAAEREFLLQPDSSF
ncbi:DUF924 family protein [Solimonas marina]|uniref:DUF924 domain-containing protein n=1 Tax=Solimonas marina TaxID=2714601 RepID=A0A969WAE5_9GAMM|nr:DUF924 family protein [Solimonas marina]NKF22398.1 DUF924 domain-containing protein [Solimonas marina]